MFKIIKITIILTVLIFLSSCSTSGLMIENKRDNMINYGKESAYADFNNRIYYISNEFDISGIYSMDMDGSDIKIEVKNPSINGIEIYDGKLFYNGLYWIAKKRSSNLIGAVNNNTVYYCTNEGIIQEKEGVDHGLNVLDFYISKSGNAVICYGAFSKIMELYDDTMSPIDRRDYNSEKITISFNYYDNMIQSDIYKIKDFLILTKHFPFNYDYERFASNEFPFVLDVNTGELVAYYKDRETRYDGCKLLFSDENNIFCAYKNMLVILDRMTYNVIKNVIIEDLKDDIKYITKDNKYLYLITDRSKLYKIDSETYEYQKINLNSNQIIIGTDKYNTIILDDKTIYKAKISGSDIVEKQKLIEVPLEFQMKNHMIDFAGGWMFLYKIYPEYGESYYGEPVGQQLLYKINIQTGQVIKNEAKMDFSILDHYRNIYLN